MPPLATTPHHLLKVLNPARRQALLALVTEITGHMRAQLELPDQRQEEGTSTSTTSTTSSSNSNSKSSPELTRLRAAALAHFDAWRKDVLAKVREVVVATDDADAVAARRERVVARQQEQQPEQGEQLIETEEKKEEEDGEREGESSGGPVTAAVDADADISALQELYHPVPTRLATLPAADREEALSCVLLLLLSKGSYAAESRALVVYLASALDLPLAVVVREEGEIARSLLVEAAAAKEDAKNKNKNKNKNQRQKAPMSADAEAQKRMEKDRAGRFWKVGLASVAGAAIIGVTGGLAAPVVAGAIGGLMSGVGLGGVASFLGVFWMNGALVGTLFGAFGARMTGEMVDQYARHVKDFRFLPLGGQQKKRDKGQRGEDGEDEGVKEEEEEEDNEARRLRVTIGINGWLNSTDDVTRPWRALDGEETEVFALRYEVDSLLALGKSLRGMVSSYAWRLVRAEILRRTVLATLWAALWPAYLVSLASSIDTPFNLARNRSEKAGQILADALINRVQGERPVTLVGYSLGARVVYACLRTLADRRAFGLVDTVVFVGAPAPSNPRHWHIMRSVVAGRMFNVYSENDYILAFMYRATSMQLGIAGLQAIRDVPGVVNLDLSDRVSGHLRYPDLIPKILVQCGFPNIKDGAGPIEEDKDEEEEEEIELQDIEKKLAIQETTQPASAFVPQTKEQPTPPFTIARKPVSGQAPPPDPGTSSEDLGAKAAASNVPTGQDGPHEDRGFGKEEVEEDEDKDENEDDHGRIKMGSYDDDDDMVSVEPVPIED